MSTIAVDKEELRTMIREAVQKKLAAVKEEGKKPVAPTKPKAKKPSVEDAKKHLKESLKLLEMMDMPMGSGKPRSKREAGMKDEGMGGGVPGAMAPTMEAAPPAPPGGTPGAPMEAGKPTVANNHAADELHLFMTNDDPTMTGNQIKSIRKNLALKMKKGKYDSALAPKIWMYLVDAAAQSYLKQYGSPGDRVDSLFNKATRMVVATALAKQFEQDVKSGNLSLDDMIASI